MNEEAHHLHSSLGKTVDGKKSVLKVNCQE